MNSKFRLTPSTPLPEDLESLTDEAVHVVHSRLRRQMDAEYADGLPSWETEVRLDEVRAELDRRENGEPRLTLWSDGSQVLSAG
ncbi:hypothetical protein [uncultured Arthrobacter sp.]|uniref:hypothetical protein n=1 Tax=uncultured Arthrobacter sp. TaxID=114050 RepID=UPI00260D9140|nr:hypothetical protein [uncultured Arthrobacter sp.]